MTEHHVNDGNEPHSQTGAAEERPYGLPFVRHQSVAADLVPLGVALHFQRLKIVHSLTGALTPEYPLKLVCRDRGPVYHQVDAVHLCQLAHGLDIGGPDPFPEQLGEEAFALQGLGRELGQGPVQLALDDVGIGVGRYRPGWLSHGLFDHGDYLLPLLHDLPGRCLDLRSRPLTYSLDHLVEHRVHYIPEAGAVEERPGHAPLVNGEDVPARPPHPLHMTDLHKRREDRGRPAALLPDRPVKVVLGDRAAVEQEQYLHELGERGL